jgi:hypothetical protein
VSAITKTKTNLYLRPVFRFDGVSMTFALFNPEPKVLKVYNRWP